MSPDSDPLLDPVRRLYVESLQEHGPTSKAVGWKDEASQRLRFEQLAKVIDQAGEPITVNDFGCGYGALFDFLASLLEDRLTAYVGVDISSEMIDAARARVADPRVTFIHADTLVAEADYTFVSGTFNVKMEASDADWRNYIDTCLAMMLRRSKRGFAFNLLSTYVDWQADHLYYGDACHFFDLCRRQAPFVTLLHDYPLYEWTILVRK